MSLCEEQLLSILKKKEANVDFKKIESAIKFAKHHHEGQKRLTGEPYYTHPITVAIMVSKYSTEENTIIAAILHDIIEDTQATYTMIHDQFGAKVMSIVEGLTRSDKYKSSVILFLLEDLTKDQKISSTTNFNLSSIKKLFRFFSKKDDIKNMTLKAILFSCFYIRIFFLIFLILPIVP